MAAMTADGIGANFASHAFTQNHQRSVPLTDSIQPALLSMPLSRCRTTTLRHACGKKVSKLIGGKGEAAVWVVSASSGAMPSIHTSLYDPAYRAKIAEEYGFTHVGEPLPPNVTLKNILDTLPPEVFKINEWKSWKYVAISTTAYAAGLFMIAHLPWYLLPFAWAWTGTVLLGFFCIGHECGHKTFCSNKLIEDIVGTLAMLPLIFPYEAWRIKHDRHHAKTNLLGEDTAWHPVVREDYDKFTSFEQFLVQLVLGPLRPLASITHWIDKHFFLDKFRPSERRRVKISLACVFGFMAIGWPMIIYETGIIGWVQFWFVPWLVYHFWMSTITMIHHSAPHILFNDTQNWNTVQAQLGGTVHCDYPKWVDLLIHDINIHIPHHITQKIPSYNLKLAHRSLRQNWGKYLNETHLSWRLMKSIMTICHIYDEDRCYVPFDEGKGKESPMIAMIRRVMPNTP